MPKIGSEYQNNIRIRTSDKMLMLINNARRSVGARQGFGVLPNQSEFIRGVIFYWVRKNAPEILEINSEIPEVLEHKNLKNNQSIKIKRSLKFNQEYFDARKRERFLAWAKSPVKSKLTKDVKS
tara:strand:+ start:1997 stop:2368 length:372 start_codon:yes stop_codon:yes gene_type:complete